jgi:ABC-type sugar transport system substrate-binding protein
MKMKTSIAALICGALLVAGCSSDKADDTTAATEAAVETTAESAAAEATEAPATDAPAATDAAVTDAAPVTEAAPAAGAGGLDGAPTAIGLTKPLPKKADKKKIAWLECELPSCAEITPGFKDGAAALGWDLEVISIKSFEPGAGVQQAIDAGANYIAITGSPRATYEEQAEAAKAKGIPILSCYATDDPSEELGLLTQCGDELGVGPEGSGGTLAKWVAKDGAGAANVLAVTIRDFPVLVAEEDGFKQVLLAECATCKMDTLNVTIEDLGGGKIPAAVASKIQADPTINYVYFTFGDLPGGVAEALKTAGLDKVKLVGVDFNKADLQAIVDGQHSAWTANPKVYAGWVMVDAAARHSVGMVNDEERAAANLPTFVVDDAASAKTLIDAGGNWAGPAGMAEQFKKLWLVG